VIFVVDAADRARFPEAKEVLEGVMEDPTLLELPLMIYANKQDLPKAASKDEIAEFFELRTLRQRCRKRKEGKIDQGMKEAAAKGIIINSCRVSID
jgi:signal recognition particle receptor subunit beta